MKRTKLGRRVGALLLAIVMMFSVLPMTAFAADDETTVSETTEVIETEVPETEAPETEATEETEAPVETEAAEETEASEETEAPEETEVPEETEETEETVEETVEETTEETMDIEFLEEDIEPLAMGTKPADGTTSGQPFVNNKPSQYYRIPAMVTLNDGTIVAATDARWDTTADGGGLDTIVSRSTDGGKNWSYTFANYLGDNGNTHNNGSTAFIDPALATDGETVYMIVDLFPAGYALNGANKQPVAGQNGFDNAGNLRLKTRGSSTYNYYLKGGKIYGTNGNAVKGYTVDEYFNIKGDKVDTNLFCADSPYQVYPTNYLYLTSSSNGGATWSAPTLINVKKANEQTCLIGPGTGIVSGKRILFAVYNYTDGDKNASVIYSDDGGKTWTRSKDMSDVSSEATIVEADGKLYLFARHGGYYVSEDNGTTWTSRKNVGISYDTGCQINALTYSEKIDGKTAILLSAPASGRSNGRIFVGLVNEDGSLSWKYTYNVNSGAYSYSCLTELSDGKIALLYENAGGSEQFETYAIETIAKGATIGDKPVLKDETVTDNGVSVTAPGLTEVEAIKTEREIEGAKNVLAYDVTPRTASGEYYDAATVSYPVPAGWNYTNIRGFVVEENGDITTIVGKVEGGKYVFTVPHFSEQGILELAAEKKVVVVDLLVGGSASFTDSTGKYDAAGNGDGYADVVVEYKQSPAGPVEVQTVENGKQYLIVKSDEDGSSNIVLTPNITGDSDKNHQGPTLGMGINQITESNAAPYLWTFEQNTNGKYLIKDANGNAITFWNNGSQNYSYNIRLSNSGSPMDITYNESNGLRNIYWTNGNPYGGNIYLNNYDQTTNGWFESSEYWRLYEMRSDESYITNITFIGKKAGNTTVVIGDTTYNIHVRNASEEDFPVISESGTDGYSLGHEVANMIMTQGKSYDLGVPNAANVKWSSANDAIASVNAEGNVTANGIGETDITAEILYPDGSVRFTKTIHVTVLDITPMSSGTTTRDVEFYVDELRNSRLFYYQNKENQYVEVYENTVFWMDTSALWAITFFGAPIDDGYALTYMSAANNLLQTNWFAIEDNRSAAETTFYKNKGSLTSTAKYSNAEVQGMITGAKNLGCDGGFWFTRAANGTTPVQAFLNVISEKLPTVTKEVDSIIRDGKEIDYDKGMTVQLGDVIRFKVTVIEYGSEHGITYTNGKLTDKLSGANFTETNRNTQSVVLQDKEQEHVYYVDYTIKAEDIGTLIKNTVTLSYDYSAEYSAGTYGGEAVADASVTAASFTLPDVVLDFGLAVDIKLEIPETAFDKTPFTGVTAEFGEVEFDVETQTVTYTPDKGFLTREYTQLTAIRANETNEAEYPFRIHPASNVLYEAEDFMEDKARTWGIPTDNSLGKQDNDHFADQSYAETDAKRELPYGYDKAYNGAIGTVGSWSQTIESGSTTPLITSFYGKTFDLIGECGPDTGMVLLVVKDANGKGKAVVVDTSFNDRNYQTISQVPWAHVEMPAVDHYNVEVFGFYRTVNTQAASFGAAGAGINDTLYAIMDELDAEGFDLSQVEFVYFDESSPLAQMENSTMMTLAEGEEEIERPDATTPVPGGRIVVDSFRVYTNTDNDAYIPAEKGVIYTNVLDAVNTDTITAYIEGTSGQYVVADYEGLGGPQNEIYLIPGQAVAFKAGSIQISIRAVKGATQYQVNGQTNVNISSNTEMYYKISAGEGGVVTIKNTGEYLLALGNIKSTISLQPLTEAEKQMVCAMLSAPVEPEPPEETDPPAEPETFIPDLKAKTNSKKQGNEKQVTVTITTSTDVEYIIIDGDRVDNWETSKNGKTRVFTYTDIIGGKEKHTYKIIAYSANGAASEPISVKG